MTILSREGVRLGLTAQDKTDAIRQCGELLVELGAATEEYAAALHEREEQVSTFIGEGVAIPHGTNESRAHIARAAIAYLQFPDGIDWDGKEVFVCIAIASKSEEHIDILQSLAAVLMNPESAARLREAADVDQVMDLLAPAA
ncbi:PTS sugar transporter subunit IIA [Demequina lignilytica]|uniref:PTS sugar transporter subunit IIA n=1 Tax=Demequina lignilytica TaxID=3051663 RepID=UPI00345E5F37